MSSRPRPIYRTGVRCLRTARRLFSRIWNRSTTRTASTALCRCDEYENYEKQDRPYFSPVLDPTGRDLLDSNQAESNLKTRADCGPPTSRRAAARKGGGRSVQAGTDG